MGLVKPLKNERLLQDSDKNIFDLSELLIQLDSIDSDVRRFSARQLVRYPDSASILSSYLQTEPDVSVRSAIMLTLSELANKDSIDGLIDCLRSENVALRNEAIEVMRFIPNEVAPFMQLLLSDYDPDVRIFSVNILESLKHPNVERWLIDVITYDDHVNVCAAAVDLLVEVATSESIEPLQKLKEKFYEEPYIVFSSELAIKRIQGG